MFKFISVFIMDMYKLMRQIAKTEIERHEAHKSFWEFEAVWLWRALITFAVIYMLVKTV